MSLRAHLVAVVLLATLPLVLLSGWQAVSHAREQRVQLEEQLTRSALALAQAVHAELQASFDALHALARTELLKGAQPGARAAALSQRLPRPDWHSVFLIDAQGTMLFDTAQGGGFAVAGVLGDLQAQVLRSGRAAVQGPVDTDRGGAAVLLALPVRRDGGAVLVLGARVDTAAWRRVAAAAGRPEGGYALVHDARHRLISSTLAEQLPPGAALPAEAVAAMGSRPAGVLLLRASDGRPVHAAWQPVPTAGWGVQVGVPARALEAARQQAVVAAWTAAALCLLLGVALAVLAARAIERPLRKLAQEGPDALTGPVGLREIAQLQEGLRLAGRRERELRRALEEDIAHRRQVEVELLAARQRAEALARAKDELLLRLGHELRNPLGAMQAAADVLESAEPGSEAAAEARAIVSRQVARLSQRLHELQRTSAG